MLPAARLRRPLGWALLVAACIVGLASLVGTVVVWVTLGDAQRSSRHALELADEALASVDNSLGTASDVVTSVRSSVGAVAGGLSDVADALGAGDAALGQLQQLVDTLPASLQSVSGALNTLGGVADDIDQTLAVVGQAPLIPDYHPALGNLVRQLQQGIDPLLTSTQGLAGEFDQARGSASDARDHVRTLAADIRSIDASLARASEQLTAYRSTTAQARALAQSARDDLDRDLTILRIVVLPLGLGLAVAQLLPLWFGAALLWPAERRLVTPFEPREVGVDPELSVRQPAGPGVVQPGNR